jgi:hypothetical protein
MSYESHIENENNSDTNSITISSNSQTISQTDDNQILNSNDNNTQKQIRRRTSIVWEFFYEEVNDHEEVIAIVCSLCKSKWKPGNTTGTLAAHLNNKHKSNISLKSSSFITTPYTKKDYKHVEELNRRIIDFIVCCQLPFSIADNPYYRTMINTFDPRYQTFCRQTLRNEIINQFEVTREKIVKILESITSMVSITCDIWTSISNQSYLGVTVHYIDNDWKARHFLLDLIHYPDNHYGINTKKLLATLFEEMKIISKIFSITTDNDASMLLACRELKQVFSLLGNNEYTHYRCSAHILNIAVKHSMQLQTEVIEKVRSFVKKVKHSQVLCDALRSICVIKEVEYLKLELDVDTRWNSTFLMLQRFKKMKEILEFLVIKNKNYLENLWLNEEEWKNVDSMIELFEPIFQATNLLSTNTYPVISDVRLVFISLQCHLDQYLSNHEIEECYMAQSIKHKLEEYWNIISESTILPTLLDPSSKLKTFRSHESRMSAIRILRTSILNYKSQSPSLPSASTKDNQNLRLFFEAFLQQETDSSISGIDDDELERYLALPLALEKNPLEWWQKFDHEFPVLSKMAKNYLSAQGTSVPSEQAFSIAAHTVTNLRNNLMPDAVRASLCLKSWKMKVRDTYFNYET